MKKLRILSLFLLCLCLAQWCWAEQVFQLLDDKSLIEAYTKKFADRSKETLIAMIRDDSLDSQDSQRTAAAIRVFRENFSDLVFAREKRMIERWLLRRRARTDSVFVEIEILKTLCRMDRYKYFHSMMPELLRRLNHYNDSANQVAFEYIQRILDAGQNRPREARIIFNILRKMLFLSRNTLRDIEKPNQRLSQKIELLRWSIKILGTDELRRLPPEALHLF